MAEEVETAGNSGPGTPLVTFASQRVATALLMPLLGAVVLEFGSFEWLFAGSIVLAIAATVNGPDGR